MNINTDSPRSRVDPLRISIIKDNLDDTSMTSLESSHRVYNSNKGHSFFIGPKFVLAMAGIVQLNFLSFKPYKVVLVLIWTMCLFQITYSLEQIVIERDFDFIFQRIANMMWCMHSTLIYAIVARYSFKSHDKGGKYFIAMEYLLEAAIGERERCDHIACSETKKSILASEERRLSILSIILSTISLCVALLNTAIVGFQFVGDRVWDSYFPMNHSLGWTISATVVWYFFSFGWGLSIIFVSLPAYVFTLRVEEYAAYIESKNESFDIELAMSWYDDLFHNCKILNEIASPLVTANVMLCFPLTVFLIMSYTNDEVSDVSAMGWILINTIVMLFSAGSVANLYAVNFRISMALGEKPSTAQFKSNQIAGYQLALLKIKAIPFGVRFYGTRMYITPSIVFRAIALVSSFSLFLKANSLSR